MKHVKILGLLAVAGATMMALTTSASATTISTTTGGFETPSIHANGEGHVTITNQLGAIQCNSSLDGNIKSHGYGLVATGNVTGLSFIGCTNSWHVTVEKAGGFSVFYSSGHDGQLTFEGLKLSATRLGVKCVYEASLASNALIFGGNPATISVVGLLPLNPSESSKFCGTGAAKWIADYISWSALYVAQ